MEKKIFINALVGGVTPVKPEGGHTGHRIGRILMESKSESSLCPSVTTLIYLGPDGRLRFSFLKSSISAQAAKKHFGGPWFKIEVSIELPANLQAKSRYQRKHIRPGNYPITQDEHFFIVIC